MTSEATRARDRVQAEAVTHLHAHGDTCAHGHALDTEAAPAAFDPAALVSARGLTLRRNGRALLLDVAIDIRPGEIVTLIGPNGAGKTTLVRVLLGLATPDAGVVHRRPGLRIGYAPQRFDLDRAIPMTVARFLALGGTTTTPIRDVLAEVSAQRVIDQQLAELSGGELQRVVLARALLREPELLVLDEPVRGVDYAGEAELYTLIGRLRQTRGLGVLLVSHDLHVVMAQSDRVVCLNRHVCCSGVPERVAQHPEYVRLFGAETARAFGLYHHHHDHSHDIAGEPRPARDGEGADTSQGAAERPS
jgi:zinc transport system ATP-binding protein